MESGLSNMLSSQNRLNNLISIVGSTGSKVQSNDSNTVGQPAWMAPIDRTLECFQLADLAEESTTTSSLNTLASLLSKYPTSESQQTLSKNRRFKSALIQLNPIVYPKQVKLCPAMEEVKHMLTDERLIISVYSYSGYSYSTEFTHVYKGKFNVATAMEDLMVVIKRALRANSSGIADKTCTSYAEFITRIGAWEGMLFPDVLTETCKTIFPTWKAYPAPVPLVNDFRFVEVFIGHNGKGELSFSVRVRTELELEAVVSSDSDKTKKQAAPDAADVQIDPKLAVECVYYREFVLNDATVGAFSQVSFMGAAPANKGITVLGKGPSPMVPPPPPPKRSKKGSGDKEDDFNDIRIFLLVSHKVVHSVAAATEGEAPLPMEHGDGAEDDASNANADARSVNDDDSLASAPQRKTEKLNQEVSFCAELFGWGFDSNSSLGLGDQPKSARKPSASAAGAAAGKDGTSAAASEQSMEDEMQDLVHGPRKIPLDRIVALERVRMLACSSNHTLLLTCMGSVFSCGDNSEGALGTGDFVSRSALTLVEWPLNAGESSPTAIAKIAAGSSSIGAHSMAVDRSGRLYGWGVAYAVGAGVVKAITTPTRLAVGSIRDPVNSLATDAGEVAAEAGQREDDDIDYAYFEDLDEQSVAGGNAGTGSGSGSRYTAAERREVVDVACGGGFSVCVTKSGHVYTWGVWAHGRLGLGPVPVIEKIRGPYRGTGKKIARYQLHPRRVKGIEGAVSVSCGEAHTLCLLRNGCLLAWGQNSCGQIGNGPSSSGMLSDSYRPVLIPHFGSIREEDCGIGRFAMRTGNAKYEAKLQRLLSGGAPAGCQGRLVACGAFHSVCVDSRGLAHTWGARGSPCLGHHDTPIVGEWNRRINSIFSIAATESKTMVPFELFAWCLTWSMPRCVQTLAGGPLQSSGGAETFLNYMDDSSVGGSMAGMSAASDAPVSAKQRIVQVCAGDLSTGFLTAEGKFFLSGSGPAVPNFMPASRTLQDYDPTEGEAAAEEDAEDKEAAEEALQKAACIVSSPRCPSDSWLRELCTRRIAYIAASGNRCYLLADEEAVSQSLTAPLLNNLLASSGIGQKQEEKRHEKYTSGNNSVSEHSGAGSDGYSSSHMETIFETRGKADCMILASGKVFLCHKALIAQRSPELRNMIIMESPTDDSTGQLVQILLPELQRDAARALMHYLYRDVLPTWCIGSMSLLTSLARTGKSLRIPRLQLLCDRFLRLLRAGDVGRSPEETLTNEIELPPPTLARDLSALVGDPEFADVRFIAEGRAIVAHRFILESRCAYFRAMFRSGMAESGGHADYAPSSAGSHRSGEIIDVVVPDTFVGFLRLLIFIYTGTLPDGSDGALLEDLMAADRYVVPEMKLLCENMLVPSESNWLDLLRAAQLLNSLRLELQVMAFLKVNFSVLRGLYDNTNDTTDPQNKDNDGASGRKEGDLSTEDRDDTIQYSNIEDFQAEFPGLLEDLLESRKVLFPLPPSQLVMQQSFDSNTAAAELHAQQKSPVFPLWALGVAAISMFIYQHISKIVALGPIIPVVNMIVLVVLLVVGLKFFTDKK